MTALSFVQKVRATIKRYNMAKPEDRLLVAVSGGADSVCLARVLKGLGYPIAIAHLNHGLRGTHSDEDERFVEELATNLDVPFFVKRIDPDGLRGNLEAAGRAARLSFFRELLVTGRFEGVAVAHSRDDRTETFLLHLFRGSGAQGLTSMKPVNQGIVRPLIEVTRDEIVAHLEDLDQAWRRDESNLDLRFARNTLRHKTLPELTASFNPKLGETLARTTEILSEESEWMEQVARDWVDDHFYRGAPSQREGGFYIRDDLARLDISALATEPVGLVRRVLRVALARAGSDLVDVGFEHLEQIRRLLENGKSGRLVELPGPIHVERSFGELLFRPAGVHPAAYEYELSIPGRIAVPETGYDFEARLADPSGSRPDSPVRIQANGESLGPYVKIRNWKNGDTYEPVGLGPSKLKTLFQDMRIPRNARHYWPVLVARSSIVWVASFPVSRDFAPSAGSRSIVEFEACPVTR